MRADKEKMVNLWLGKTIASLKGYRLENYPFDFTGGNFQGNKSGKTDAAWKLMSEIRMKGLSPRRLLRLIILAPTILFILARLKINAFVTAYLTSNFYYTLPETKRRNFLMKNIWGGKPGRNWNRALENVYANSKDFRAPREQLIRVIRSLDPGLYDGVIELGTGNGWFLNHLSKKMARKFPLTGLDLNQHTILRDRAKYKKNKSLRFLCSDLPTYAKRASLKRKLLISCFVLEFFSHRELIKLCKLLRTNASNYLAIIERIDSPHKVKQKSKPIGGFSYSHDYERIFKKYGIQKMYTHEDTAQNPGSNMNLTALFKTA